METIRTVTAFNAAIHHVGLLKDCGTLITRTATATASLLLKFLAPIVGALFVNSEMTKSMERLKAKLEQMYPQAGTAKDMLGQPDPLA